MRYKFMMTLSRAAICSLVLAALAAIPARPVARDGHAAAPARTSVAGVQQAAVNLGHVQIIAEIDQRVLAGPPELPTGPAPFMISKSVSLDEAQGSVDFSIVLPSWLPDPAYSLGQVFLLGDGVQLDYQATTGENPGDILIWEQPWANLGGQWFVGGDPQEGTIGGTPAAFWEQTTGGTGQPMQNAAWERGDLLIQFMTRGIAPSTITEIAQSLRAYQADRGLCRESNALHVADPSGIDSRRG